MRKILGVAMSLMMMLAACGGTSLKTQTFTSNATWTAPTSVSSLVSLVGKGGTGQPESEQYMLRYTSQTNIYKRRRSDGVVEVTYGSIQTHIGSAPSDYCLSPIQTPGDPVYSESWTCVDYTDTSYWQYIPPTTGDSTTGFGKTFPGGYGGPASPATYNEVAVTPGQSYSLVIPSGGSITISYYE
jgi:hypothetical protein